MNREWGPGASTRYENAKSRCDVPSPTCWRCRDASANAFEVPQGSKYVPGPIPIGQHIPVKTLH